MAFTDPQSITINAIANSLPRVSSQGDKSTYSKDDGTLKLTISHSYGKRNRRVVRVDSNKIVSDPLIPANSVQANMAVYLVMDVPRNGYTIAEEKQIVDGLLAYLSASSGSAVTKTLGGEN